MQGDDHTHITHWLDGPRLWALSAFFGAAAGVAWAVAMPAAVASSGRAVVPMVLVVPFVVLLLSIAVCPLVHARWWHRHYPDVAFFFGAVVGAYYLTAYRGVGGTAVLAHTAAEYVAFIALIGGLYVVSGGVVVRLAKPVSPAANTVFLLVGAVLANIVGTTGASVLLIRPFLRANEGRLKPLHVVFFIFIVSNCGGLLTPIGDPPLYLGFVKGVPFFWTTRWLGVSWALVVGCLLAVFFVFDSRASKQAGGAAAEEPRATLLPRIAVSAHPRTLVLLGLMVGAVFLDPVLGRYINLHHVPVGAIVQIVLAVLAYTTTPQATRAENDFSMEPVKEVGVLFAGIFLTMMPALAYLAANGARLGVDSPTAFYFATGTLSATLDNAPTYLNFLQVAIAPDDVSPQRVRSLISTDEGRLVLEAISTGAVFFGAMTYIGNGPNFMVRAIAERGGVKMPSFFAYAGWAVVILLPVLVMHWFVVIR